MVKHLWLVRHAEAAEGGMGTPDHERPLTPQGAVAATRLGKHLQQIFPDPQRIISSTALRAHTTAQLLAEQYGNDPAGVHADREIYEASVRTFLQEICSLPSDCDRVIMVGHNPTLSYLAEYLTGAEIGGLWPGSAVYMTQEADTWEAFSQGTATFVQRVDGSHLMEV